ncbi:unnamed protein product, partial [Prorocentrum cordatum]
PGGVPPSPTPPRPRAARLAPPPPGAARARAPAAPGSSSRGPPEDPPAVGAPGGPCPQTLGRADPAQAGPPAPPRRRLAEAGSTMVRCQEVPASEAVVGSSGFPRDRSERKHRFVLSHPWLSKEHPDPGGTKLQRLVQQVDFLDASDDDAIFVDYMGLPQYNQQDAEYRRLELEGKVPKPGEHPADRTEEEETLFKKALGSMEMIYSVGNTPVIVLPMNDEVAAGTEYFSRGWCFFEFPSRSASAT